MAAERWKVAHKYTWVCLQWCRYTASPTSLLQRDVTACFALCEVISVQTVKVQNHIHQSCERDFDILWRSCFSLLKESLCYGRLTANKYLSGRFQISFQISVFFIYAHDRVIKTQLICRRKWSNVRLRFCGKSYKICECGISWQLKFDLYWCEHRTAFLPNELEHMLHCLFRLCASFLSIELDKLCLIQHKVRVVQTDSISSDRTSPGTKLFLQAIYNHMEW